VAEVVPGAASVTAEVVAALEAVEAPEEASVTEVAAVVAEDLLQEAVASD